MRTENKGYTLFELMVSIAIFALVMVGIISLMRSSSIFYRGGQNEVRLQEEAQIALNQVEDLLIDTNDRVVEVSGTNQARIYSVHKADGVYGLKQDGDRLLYKKVTSGSVSDPDGWVLMAEGVDNFKIDGIDYQNGADRNHGDNRVSVQLDLSNGKYEYVAKRDVYFRNAIENNTPFTIPPSVGTSNPSAALSFDYTYYLRRGEKLNLFAEFDIVSDAALNSTKTSLNPAMYYTLTYVDNSVTGFREYYVETGANLETITESVTDMEGIYITGKTKAGNVINVKLLTDPVGWLQPVPYFFLETHCSQNEGSPTWVEFKGVDLRGVTNATYTMKLYNEGGGQIPNSSIVTAAFGQSGGRLMSEGGTAGSQARILLSADACSQTGFLKIYQKNDVAEGADAFVTKQPRYLEVAFAFKINGEDVSGTVDFRLSTLGSGVLN